MTFSYLGYNIIYSLHLAEQTLVEFVIQFFQVKKFVSIYFVQTCKKNSTPVLNPLK